MSPKKPGLCDGWIRPTVQTPFSPDIGFSEEWKMSILAISPGSSPKQQARARCLEIDPWDVWLAIGCHRPGKDISPFDGEL
jgi:hypothetical protein